MERAHSLVTIKRVEPETRTIRGLATSPSPDREGDIVLPGGAAIKLPLPLLYQHRHDEPIGEVVTARVTPEGIWISAKLAAEGVSQRIDEAWAMIREGLVRGLSIGFIGKDREPLPGGGWVFKAWEMVELSCVTVPANSACTIQEIKSLDARAKSIGRKQSEGAVFRMLDDMPARHVDALRGIVSREYQDLVRRAADEQGGIKSNAAVVGQAFASMARLDMRLRHIEDFITRQEASK